MSKKISKKERVAIYIDGSNLYHKLKEIGIENSAYFKYSEFSKMIARGKRIVAERYYVGVVRAQEGNQKSKHLQENQVRLFNHLRKEGFSIQYGYLMKNEGVFHEKGVDVKMAVDLLVGAYEDLYDTALLVSSDTDLIPAIQKVRDLGKSVEYIGFSHKPSYGLIKRASETRLLSKEDIALFQQERR